MCPCLLGKERVTVLERGKWNVFKQSETATIKTTHYAEGPLLFDDKLLMMAWSTRVDSAKKYEMYDEDELEVRMLEWIGKTNRVFLDLYVHSDIDIKFRDVIEAIGLPSLVSSYCSSKFCDNAPQVFKTELRDMDSASWFKYVYRTGSDRWRSRKRSLPPAARCEPRRQHWIVYPHHDTSAS